MQNNQRSSSAPGAGVPHTASPASRIPVPEGRRSFPASASGHKTSGKGVREERSSRSAAGNLSKAEGRPVSAADRSSQALPVKKKQKPRRRGIGRRVKGKPSSSPNSLGFFRFFSMFISQGLKVLLIFFLLFCFALLGLGTGLLSGYISTVKGVEISDINSLLSSERTKILDMNGDVIDTLKGSGSTSEFVPFSEIKDSYIDDAFIAIEDERFESHPGIDSKRILSALVSFIVTSGNPTHGGSTITQQVVRMITGQDERSAQRKIQEWYNAIELEKNRSKDSIMELYLNLVPMANNLRGVQTAAKAYFNKDARDLNLAECALLAGIPNRPQTYNPMTEYGRRNCLRRMRIVLTNMLERERITPQQYDEALNTEIRFDFRNQEKDEENVHNWFVEYVIDEVQRDLISKKGYNPELAAMAVYNYGLIIETAEDPEAQKKLEEVFKDESLFVQDKTQIPDTPEHPQAAITLMDNREGSRGLVRAIVGGYGEKKANLVFNLATDAHRQPGSSIKPVLVYAPAIEVGAISQATPLDDKPMHLDPNDPSREYPQNYSRTYRGPVTLEYAILMSLNTIAAEIYAKRLGPEVGLSYLKESGVDRTDEPYVATSLGGFSKGMSSYEMAEAYSVLANGGVYTKPSAYLRVLNQNGTVLLDNTVRESHRVYRPGTTYIITQMLRKVAEVDWNFAMPSNTLAAGKTGTTENFRDVWFCGYTPYYTAAVWYGYANASGRNTSVPEIDGKNPCRIWKACMESLHQDLPRADWARPDDVINLTVCKESGMVATEYCEEKMNVLLLDGSPANPSEPCSLHTAEKQREKEMEEMRNRMTLPNGLPVPTITLPLNPNHGNSGFRIP